MKTLGQLQRCTLSGLIERFGEHHGRELHDRAHFRSASRVARRKAKSRSVEATFDTDIADLGELEAILRRQSRDLAKGLAKNGNRGRTIAIKVRLDDFTTLTRARTIPEMTNDETVITEVALDLLRANRPERPVRLLGVRVGSFEEDEKPGKPTAEPGQTALTLPPAEAA